MKLTLPFLVLLAGLVTACARPSGVDVADAPAETASEAPLVEAEAEVLAAFDELAARFNAMDLEGWEAMFHFPNVRLMGGTMTVIEARGMQPFDQIEARFAAMGWHHTTLDRREVIYLDENKAHVDVDFTRHREDGSVIGSYNGLYIFTREDGRWGVKVSSFFGL